MAPASVEFSASYDRTAKIVSAAVSGVLLAVSLLAPHVLFAAVSILIVALAYAFSPRGYVVSPATILVRRLIGSARFPLTGIADARRAGSSDLSGAIRLWGSGGMFGYYGLFQTSRLGRCRWYVTDRRNAVIVTSSAGTVVFSPDDVDGFLAALPPVSGAPVSAVELAQTVRARRSRRTAALWIGLAVGIAAIALVALAIAYSPGPPKLTLTPQGLTIHDRFYPVTIDAADVDAARIRIVDLAVDPDWRPTMRTNGFANFHYRSGWFRTANGRKVRLYQAGGTRLVLLPPKGNGAPVLLEVAAPEDFVGQVRGEWSRAH